MWLAPLHCSNVKGLGADRLAKMLADVRGFEESSGMTREMNSLAFLQAREAVEGARAGVRSNRLFNTDARRRPFASLPGLSPVAG